MSDIFDAHEGHFNLDHLTFAFTLRQLSSQQIEIIFGDIFARVLIVLNNDGRLSVVTRSYDAIVNDENNEETHLGNIRKDF